jgi:predicted glycosyltransferase involved in capsule biosynthesis
MDVISPKLTIVIPNRNRLAPYVYSTEYLFMSLDNQTFKNFQTIVVDGGSDNFEKLKNYVCGFPNTSIIQYKIEGSWNKCILNNIGIQNSKTEYVMTTDADMLFGKGFIEKVYKNLFEDSFIESRTTYIPTGVMWKIYKKEIDFLGIHGKYQKFGRTKKRSTCGGCQATSYKNWEKLKGYNESMIGWGSEDQELLKRAEILGLKIVWLGEKEDCILFHQEHQKEDIKEDLKCQDKNKIILENCNSLEVNNKGWGTK